MSHPAAESLELYVIGAHDQVSIPDIEAHLRACPACTDEVRRQAQIDLALAEVAAEATFCPGCGAVMVAPSCAHCGAVAEAGGFRIERVLVQNAHGRMYLARDPEGNAVALKELAFVQAPHSDAVDAFEREARLLRQLSHPQIPRFLAAFREGEGVHTRLYLAQEYVDGESLQERLNTHQFSEAEARDVAEQVLSILEYLQGLSPMVFHRDIKPANLIRRADGRIALVDFGAARDLGATVGATLVGTFGYMPLEQMGGIVDGSTDLYALGATLCHLLSRKPPWKFVEDPTALERLNVSRGFRAYLGKLTARQPQDRYCSAADAVAGLRAPPRRKRPPVPTWKAVAFIVSGVFVVTGALAMLAVALPLWRYRTMARRLAEPDPDRAVTVYHDRDVRLERRESPQLEDGTPAGSILLNVCASDTGEITDVRVLSGALNEYTSLVIGEARKLRYPPYLLDGKPVPHCRRVQYTVRKR